jgi:hypothetical protein
MRFCGTKKRAKVKHDTLCNTFEKGGLQSVDIELKIKALQLSWVHRLFNENEHQWKVIPKYYLTNIFGEANVFHPYFSPPKNVFSTLPIFIRI